MMAQCFPGPTVLSRPIRYGADIAQVRIRVVFGFRFAAGVVRAVNRTRSALCRKTDGA